MKSLPQDPGLVLVLLCLISWLNPDFGAFFCKLLFFKNIYFLPGTTFPPSLKNGCLRGELERRAVQIKPQGLVDFFRLFTDLGRNTVTLTGFLMSYNTLLNM